MPKKLTWYPVIIHYGNDFHDKALARKVRTGLFAISANHLGIYLRMDQYKDDVNPVWWEKTGISEDHKQILYGGHSSAFDLIKEWED